MVPSAVDRIVDRQTFRAKFVNAQRVKKLTNATLKTQGVKGEGAKKQWLLRTEKGGWGQKI